MVNGPKYCLMLNGSIFAIFIDLCENNSGWKRLSDWYPKYQDTLLTHWLLITCILFLIKTIYSNIFRCNYLRNEKRFLNFFFTFCKFRFNFEHFQKKGWHSSLIYFWTCRLRKTWWGKCLKSPLSEDPWTSNTVNGPKHCLMLNDRNFTIFIDPCEDNSGWKVLSQLYQKS